MKPLTVRAGWDTEVALEILPEPPVRVDSGGSSFLCVITLLLSHFEDLFGKLQDSDLRNSAWTSSHLPRKTMAPALTLVLLPRSDFLVRSLESLTSPTPTPFVP